MTWDEAVAFALTLAGTELATSYRQPAVKANGHTLLNTGNEPDTSFVLHLDIGLTELLAETHPATFWKTPHYEGYATVLVRYDGPDAALVREMIERGHGEALAKKRKPR